MLYRLRILGSVCIHISCSLEGEAQIQNGVLDNYVGALFKFVVHEQSGIQTSTVFSIKAYYSWVTSISVTSLYSSNLRSGNR